MTVAKFVVVPGNLPNQIWPVCDGCNPMRMGGDISEDDLTCVEAI